MIGLVVLLALASPGANTQLVLTERGEARCVIVTPAAASATVQKAAKELAAYLEKMAGAKIRIVTEGVPVNALPIDVGPTERARAMLGISVRPAEEKDEEAGGTPAPRGAGLWPANEEEKEAGGTPASRGAGLWPANEEEKGAGGTAASRLASDDAERVRIHADAQGVVVCGGGDRGTLFGVYRFLEALGCRWLAADCEFVPRVDTLALRPIDIDSRPAFTWRLFKGIGAAEAQAWGLKKGMNGFYPPQSAHESGGSVHYPDGGNGVHAYAALVPAKTYFEPHPEWFPLVDGKRVRNSSTSGQLCVTAPGLADEFARRVIRLFDADPAAPLTSISPNDGYGWCECADCQALDERLCGARQTEQGLNAAKPFMGDRVFWFANEVAARVAKVHADKKLLVLAYVNYAEPPDTVRPLDNVVPFLCHYAPADYSRPISDPSSPANRLFNDALERWTQITPQVMFYSYVSKSQWWRLPRPVLGPFAADVKYLYSLGVRRYFCQSSLSDWPLDGPLYYVIAKLLWDPSAQADVLAAEWTRLMFGPAANDVGTFYQKVASAAAKTGRSYAGSPRLELPGLFDHALLADALAALEAAERKATTEPYRGREEQLARTFRYGHAMVRAMDAYEAYKETLDPAQLRTALELGRQALRYNREPKAREMVDLWEKKGVLPQFSGATGESFGKPEIKGGRPCWNSDESGPGDAAQGWAVIAMPAADLARPLVVEVDVWGESALRSLVIDSGGGKWVAVVPHGKLSGRPGWETLVYRVPAELLQKDKKVQRLGFGGSDTQVWIADVRSRQE